jgi:hypothetical protein
MRATNIIAILVLLLLPQSSFATTQKEKLATTTMPGKETIPCSHPKSIGTCMKNAACGYAGCKLCVQHCSNPKHMETADALKTPKPTHSLKEQAKAKIHAAAVDRTLAPIHMHDANS